MDSVLHFNISGMRCAGCVSAVQTAIESVTGVTKAEVKLDNHAAQVSVSDETSAANIIAVVEKAGFQAELN